MPIILSARKALRQSRRRQIFNLRIKRKLKAVLRQFGRQTNQQELKNVYSAIDIAKKKRIIHRNKAQRLKRQAARLLSSQSKQKKSKPAAKKIRTSKKLAGKK